jgi:hypothetical protein
MARGRELSELVIATRERETLKRWARRPNTAQALAQTHEGRTVKLGAAFIYIPMGLGRFERPTSRLSGEYDGSSGSGILR